MAIFPQITGTSRIINATVFYFFVLIFLKSAQVSKNPAANNNAANIGWSAITTKIRVRKNREMRYLSNMWTRSAIPRKT